MTSKTRRIAAAASLSALALVGVSGCSSSADTVSYNLSKDAEQFKIERRIVFFNGITDKYLLVVEGRCSVEQDSRRLEVTCKTGPEEFKKHYLGLSDNVSYFSEQIDSADVDEFSYKILFRPESIIPDVDLVTSGETAEGTG